MKIKGEDGYELWLRYRRVEDKKRLAQYRKAVERAVVLGKGATTDVIKKELKRALPALLDKDISVKDGKPSAKTLLAGTTGEIEDENITIPQAKLRKLGDEGFLIRTQKSGKSNLIVITGKTGPAVLTGVFHFLRLLQTHRDISKLDISNSPRIRRRILNHWDNIDGSIERGYAGKSIWNWDQLPETIDQRYHDYARACASLGLNGATLNNSNAQPESLTTEYLIKTAVLADVFRPYGIRVYLSIVFTAPMQIDKLPTSDPREPAVAEWWKKKADEIYRFIPDFGGFQIKANSEGQPGPQDYGANHDDGANMLADALAPHGGIVLWRAFVYDTTIDADRHKCANKEFEPLDGRFRPNVFVQAKNGAIDFQPREPFHPLFGAMKKTLINPELQITQEYLGQSLHLVYLADMWKEVLDSDTYAKGPGSTVARIIDGSLHGHKDSAIVGVSNIGSDRNWCGHHFSQANLYAYGRLAWDYGLTAEQIADEWIRMTWSNEPEIVDTLKDIMLGSRQACIDYMTPLGLHHIMQEGHHYGPDPAFDAAPREDWNSTFYHRADTEGLGFNRSSVRSPGGSTGSNAVGQYHSPLREQFDNIDTCPEKYLLWFHHVPWDRRLKSGRTLWQELQHRYDVGVEFVDKMCDTWKSLQDKIDPQRFEHVSDRLKEQQKNARLWREVCIDYFRRFAEK